MKPLHPFTLPLEGLHLVEASAGTGKTYSIASLYVRALVETSRTVEQILVVTYTEAATGELRERLVRRIRRSIEVLETGEAGGEDFADDLLEHVQDRKEGAGRLKNALHQFDRAAILTIHGFCNQVLQRQAFESRVPFDAELVGDDSELVGEAVDDYWRRWVETATEQSLRRPLLKKLIDAGMGPDTLTGELAEHVSRPYLKVVGGEELPEGTEEQISRLTGLYGELQQVWREEREQICGLLESDRIKHYQSRHISIWTAAMDRWLEGEVAPLHRFRSIEKWTQSSIDGSLKKGATEAPQHRFFAMMDRYLEQMELFESFPAVFRRRVLDYLRREMDGRKEALQVFSYDDLLVKVRDALHDAESGERLVRTLRKRYPLAMVDEFQDTDPIQYDIFRTLYAEGDPKGTGLFMIGDPKQSIYSFRGADIFTYLRAAEDVPDDRVYVLDRNFRSVPGLIGAVNALFGRHSRPFLLERIGFRNTREGKSEYRRFSDGGTEPPPLQFMLPDTGDLQVNSSGRFNITDLEPLAARTAASEIRRLLNSGSARIGNDRVRAGDIAVIVRTHHQAEMMGQALQERGINSVEFSKKGVFHTPEAGDLHDLLRAVSSPTDPSLIRAALCTPLIGFTAGKLLEMEENEEKWTEQLERFRRWHEAWQQHGIGYLFRMMMVEADIGEQLIGRPGGERSLTNLVHLAERLQAEEQQGRGGSRNLLKWMVRRQQDTGPESDEELLRLESDENLVQVITMHRSKGLEFPIVFCPFMWKGPRYASSTQPVTYHREGEAILDLSGTADAGGSGKRMLSALEELAESLRLAYVAITRAQQRCCITWLPAYRCEFSPLGYLLDDPERILSMLRDTLDDERSYRFQPDRFPAEIRRLAESIPSIGSSVVSPAGEAGGEEPAEEGRPELTVRSFSRPDPQPVFSVTSFSSMTSGSHDFEEIPGYEYYFDRMRETESPPGAERSIFTFPRGPEPGTCIHNILEEADFRNLSASGPVVDEQLRTFGISAAWKPVVMELLDRVSRKPLPGAGDGEIRLSEPDPLQMVPEMEFYFRNGEIEAGRLVAMIRNGDNGGLEGSAGRGFMKGFIDLTFCHGGKYYLVDYKTNHLGDSAAEYGQNALEAEIRAAFYDLQYHIYTVALHRYLARRLPGYRYDTHFGGVWYLFLRGMNGDGEEGIWFDRPEQSLVETMNRCLAGGER